MRTQDDLAVAAGDSVDGERWVREFDRLMGRIAGRFCRVEPRRRVRSFLLGLLGGLPRTNCWTIAEHAGDLTPSGMQHLLSKARWDADAVRDDLRSYVVDHLADAGAVLVVDETGDLKKGTATVGVQRQYTGTAGRIENAQVAVYLTYASPAGHALIDRALYLPRSWADDPDRRRAARIPEEVEFATKPQLAVQMIEKALAAGVPAAWATADEVYGQDPELRETLRARGTGYVFAVACNHRVATPAGPTTAAELAAIVPKGAWQILSCGPGAKGDRRYRWALIELAEPAGEQLLIRRSLRSGELAFYRCWAPRQVPLGALVRVAGTRWTTEENFQQSKQLAALDQHQVRRWTSWHRWTVLSMLAHAFLAVIAAAEPRPDNAQDELLPLTCSEIRHIFNAIVQRVRRNLRHALHWSRWRRRHQHQARTSHYRRQTADQP